MNVVFVCVFNTSYLRTVSGKRVRVNYHSSYDCWVSGTVLGIQP